MVVRKISLKSGRWNGGRTTDTIGWNAEKREWVGLSSVLLGTKKVRDID